MASNEEMKTSTDNQSIQSVEPNDGKSALKSPKRRRDADQRILDQFWIICDPNPFKRNKSLKSIIEILIKQNETNGSNDLMYCLERVVRGMASARQFARHGFCVLLTQLLTVFESKISLDLVFDLSEKHLGKTTELSNHDSVIGWSLVMASIIKSQRLTQSTNKEGFQKIFDVLYTLGMNKQYIELVICQLFNEFIILMSNKKSLFQSIVSKKLKQDFDSDNKYKPFFIFVCLSISEHFSNFPENKDLKFMIKEDQIERLSLVIRESTAYQPSVHPFNKLIIKNFILNKNVKLFTTFWSECIDETLFTPNHIEKGLLGFELLKISFQFIESVENVSTILSQSFLRLFILSLSLKTHPLYSASQKMCEFFINFVKTIEKSELQLEIVNCFTEQPGSLLFDDISKSKFLTNLLRNLNTTAIKEWTQKLKTLFLTTNKVDSNDILRTRLIGQITNLCKSLISSEDTDILWSNIKFLLFHSYFDLKDKSQPIEEMLRTPVSPIKERLRHTLRDGFRNAFNLSLHSDSKTIKDKLTHEVSVFLSIIEFINDLVSNETIECLADSNCLQPFHTIVRKVNRLKKKLKSNPSNETEIKIFILLYSMFAIQAFEEYEEINKLLPDLDECSKRALNESSEETDDSSPVWSDVLTDLLISMLTSSSKLLKNVLFMCFKHICCHITNTGIQRLIDTIIPSNDNKLFGDNEDSDEEEVVGEENDKSESESDSDSEEEDNQNLEIDEKFRNDVINALGPAAENDDEESVYLSDSEMFQIDESLATVFKTKFNDKKETIEKKNSIITFRLRSLELIQILLSHKNVDLDKVYVFIEPIVSVAKSSTQNSKQNQLSNKAIQLIIQITKIKDIGDNSLEVNNLKHILNYLLTVLSKTIHSELQKALISLIIWNISLSKKLYPSDDWYLSDIKTALISFFEKNNCQIPVSFVKSLISSHIEIGFKLYDIFFEYSFKENVRPFKKSTALIILLTLCKTQKSKSNVNSMSTKRMIFIREKCLKELCNELSAENLRTQYVSELLKLFSFTDNYLKDQNSEQKKLSDNDYQELSSKLKTLNNQKKRKLNVKEIIKKIISTVN